MARNVAGVTIKFRRNTAAGWTLSDFVLAAGEPGYERDTGRLKIGDGFTQWNDLEYFLTDDYIRALIQEIIDDNDGAGGDPQALIDHINSLTPHPVYDDGPSLALLYENAKV